MTIIDPAPTGTVAPIFAARERLHTAHVAMQRAVEDAVYDTPERAARRVEILAGLYDDDAADPEQFMRDLLTDVIHEVNRRGLHLVDVIGAAEHMVQMERDEWGSGSYRA